MGRGDSARWFGVRAWLSWSLDDEPPSHVEETVYLVRSISERAARDAVRRRIRRDSESDDFITSEGRRCRIRLEQIDSIWDTDEVDIESGMEAFSQLYEIDEAENEVGLFSWVSEEVRATMSRNWKSRSGERDQQK